MPFACSAAVYLRVSKVSLRDLARRAAHQIHGVNASRQIPDSWKLNLGGADYIPHSAAAGDIDVAFIGCDAPQIAAAIFRIANRQSKPLITLSNDLHCL
jgi:hypothetical protein